MAGALGALGLAAGGPGGGGGDPAAEPLPPLRDDLGLHPGPRSRNGAPTWTLYDPAANRFLRIGWREFEVLSRWDLGSAKAIAEAVTRATPLTVTPDDVMRIVRFLEGAGAVRGTGPETTRRLMDEVRRRRQNPAMWAVKNYLFVRVPLVRPDAFLAATLPLARPFIGRGFAWLMLAVAALGLFLVARQWESFVGGFAYLITPAGMVTAAAALILSKILHELAHAYVCKAHGCRVAHMGVALLVLWPVLYTDTTDSWRLTDRRQRIRIGLAGMAAELSLAAVATLVWTVLPDGPLRSSVFTLAAVTWLLTLAINLNPFMRFDGYYLLSDAWDIPNLQERSFALARWALRERLWGLGFPPPEPLPRRRRRLLIAFAYGTWIYRFFLFLGIALLVYHLFFKVLGLFLMIVEIVYFILRPIAREIAAWWGLRKEAGMNARVLVTFCVLAGLVALFVVPWQTRFSGPALLRATERGGLYAVRPAQVDSVLVDQGASVSEGAPLIRLVSPDLDYEIAKAEREIATLQAELLGFEVSGALAGRGVLARQALEEAAVELAGLERERAELEMTAPFDGVVTELADHLRPGLWVIADEKLAGLERELAGTVEAYVTEEEVPRIALGDPARFYPESPDWAPIEARVVALDDTAIEIVDDPELATVNGGGLPATAKADGTLVPDAALYRLRLQPLEPVDTDLTLRGTALVWGVRESFAERIWRRIVGILVRESGF